MNVQSIYSLARTLSGTDSTNMPDATLLPILQISYHDLENTIVTQVNEDFFYDEWVTDTVIDQREYTFPVKSGTTAGLKKLLGVSMKFLSTDTEYTKLRETRLSSLDRDVRYYMDGQTSGDPFYIVADKSVFVYPDPEYVITGGLRLYGISNLGDLASNSSETDVKIPIEFHEHIAFGMVPYIYQARQMITEKNDSFANYERMKANMVSMLSDRTASPSDSVMPSTYHLS